MAEREFRVLVHEEDGAYWAEVDGLPGCFASGSDLDELRDAVVEAISVYLAEGHGSTPPPSGAAAARVGEMRVLVGS
ncbi:MAG TPA: type II toxin-antitoxin system HicB family antitoxin [Gaiellaceae bacterium]|nr:type II toxin-antitoxin system HicB family antitoxin [Gaiellaceae bacterium]